MTTILMLPNVLLTVRDEWCASYYSSKCGFPLGSSQWAADVDGLGPSFETVDLGTMRTMG
jgi:hypothetical protein